MSRPNLPLFYSSLVMFDMEAHGQLSASEAPSDYHFARAANVIPLLINEIPLAIRHYPVVFARGRDDEAFSLVAVVGLGDNVNRFVDKDGKWRANTYIPAWVRRYPFISVRINEGQESALAFDSQAEWLSAPGGDVLVVNGKPSSRLEYIIAFQKEFEIMEQLTQAAVMALTEADVLEEGSLHVKPPGAWGGEKKEIRGFSIISENRLRALPYADVWMLHKADVLSVAYASLLSLGNLSNLFAVSGAEAVSTKRRSTSTQDGLNKKAGK